MTKILQSLEVEIWSDVVCPWCWIGLTRFEKALAAFEPRDRIQIRRRAYRLMSGQTPRPVEEALARKTGGSAAEVARMFAHVESVAAEEGLSYRLAGSLIGDTLDAHRLLKLAEAEGRGSEALKRFYRACLTEGRSIFDRASLEILAAEAGLDAGRARDLLAGSEFHVEVEADQQALKALGGGGVPFFVIGGRYAVSGAQPTEVFAQALTRAWAERPAQPEIFAEGATCGPDGCRS